MVEFEKLQELWQGQAAPAIPPAQIAAFTRSLQAYGRRQRWILVGKVLLIVTILAWELTQLHRPNQVAAVLLISAAVAVVLILEWRKQGHIARLDFAAPSLSFVREAGDRLRAEANPLRRIYWPFVGTLVIAMNLMLGSSHRIGWRLLASALPFGAAELGRWFRRKRLAIESRPLLDQLAAMQAALEERCQ